MSACFLVLAPLLFAATTAGKYDNGTSGPSRVHLRADQISGIVEVTGDAYRKASFNASEKSKSELVSIVHTLDGTRYEVDLDAKAIMALPCKDIPDRPVR